MRRGKTAAHFAFDICGSEQIILHALGWELKLLGVGEKILEAFERTGEVIGVGDASVGGDAVIHIAPLAEIAVLVRLEKAPLGAEAEIERDAAEGGDVVD